MTKKEKARVEIAGKENCANCSMQNAVKSENYEKRCSSGAEDPEPIEGLAGDLLTAVMYLCR